MSEHSDRMATAIQQALASRGGSLGIIARSTYPALSASGYLKACPFCESRDKFAVKMAGGGHWYWGCHNPSCSVHFDKLKTDRTGDTIGFLMVHRHLDRNAAVDLLLDLAGVANPRKDLASPKSKRTSRTKAKPSPPESGASNPESIPGPKGGSDGAGETEREEEIPEEELFHSELSTRPQAAIPPQPAANVVPFTFSLENDTDENLSDGPSDRNRPPETVWDDIHRRLSLNPADTESLKRKRGLDRETIDALGFRSSKRDNKALLQPILANYSAALLQSEGIAHRDPKGELKLNPQLFGYGLASRGKTTDEDKWDWTHPILIPYFDCQGRVETIRPHKGGLSGKRYMREQGYELGFRASRTRVRPYVTPLLWKRPEGWTQRCVLTEGEFKAAALHCCGIPAVAVPGIQMPRNDAFLENLADLLRSAGIREVIVCYDNEDKSHKPDPWTRYEAEVYALFACHALRLKGFITAEVRLPDDWRIDGKADWDGALANFGRATARREFDDLLKTARRYYPQFELFGTSERDRVIHCKLNRLTLNPTILTGGEEEEETARLILQCPMPWRMTFQASILAQELFDTRGCLYVPKKKAVKDLRMEFKAVTEISNLIEELDPENLSRRAELDAALATVQHCINGRPEILADFSITCEFQLRKQSGDYEKLFRFKNKHGQLSPIIPVPSAAASTSTKFREFAMSKGNFNPTIGDKHLQALMIDLGAFSAWREIREIELLGYNPESGLWIFGDCAITPDGTVLFADDHDVIWHDGIGYRIDPTDLRDFAHQVPPKFFQQLGKEPFEVLQSISSDQTALDAEELAVARIFYQLCADFIATFGDGVGLLVLGIVLAYTVAPELLAKYHGHPGLWIHGRAFAGKTETVRFLMQLWGYSTEYRNISLSSGSTNVGIDRPLAQYSCIPMHLDEFRQDEADKARIATLRMCFNRQAKSKGKLDQTNLTRSVQPMTSPVVTGEGVTNDSATLSRYVEAILAADRRLGSPASQGERYRRMLGDAPGYHRIIRWLLMNRKWYAKTVIEALDNFIADPETAKNISSDRLRITYGTAYAASSTLVGHFLGRVKTLVPEGEVQMGSMNSTDITLLRDTASGLLAFTHNRAREATADVASINFVVKFWTDVITLMARDQSLSAFIWFERCTIDAEGRVTRTNCTTDTEGTVRCVIVHANPLYAEYESDCRKRGHNPELSLSNIRAECQAERYWVKAPKNSAHRAHRFVFDKNRGQINCWVLRCDLMDASLAQVFHDRFTGAAREEQEETFSF